MKTKLQIEADAFYNSLLYFLNLNKQERFDMLTQALRESTEPTIDKMIYMIVGCLHDGHLMLAELDKIVHDRDDDRKRQKEEPWFYLGEQLEDACHDVSSSLIAAGYSAETAGKIMDHFLGMREAMKEDGAE